MKTNKIEIDMTEVQHSYTRHFLALNLWIFGWLITNSELLFLFVIFFLFMTLINVLTLIYGGLKEMGLFDKNDNEERDERKTERA